MSKLYSAIRLKTLLNKLASDAALRGQLPRSLHETRSSLGFEINSEDCQ